MIPNLFISILEVIIGLAGGLAVGGGFVAFLTVLGIIPRLIQLSRTAKYIHVYVISVITGTLFGTYMSFAEVNWDQPTAVLILWGTFHGIFNGMLAAALTEVLNVFPIISKRIRMEDKLLWFLMAIVFGKIAGSIFQWTFFMK
ncbi:stage V sporulation protein AB [Virgibacillus siamensis]|uniref:stage V sporulation protein AB n=1 Tax=Virgibacillus siamensis TaxID=480071 RepID=UPI000986A584|nr:stage V sporulation protein AB [Virgibacillus siamensis]